MDYFGAQGRRRGNSVTQDRLNAPLPQQPTTPGTPGARPGPSLESLRAPSSIRIRRLPSGVVPQLPAAEAVTTGRRRSSSEPQRFGSTLSPPSTDLSRQRTQEGPRMQTVTEEGSRLQPVGESSQDIYREAEETPQAETPYHDVDSYPATPMDRIRSGASAVHEAGNAARSNRGLRRFRTGTSASGYNENPGADEYNSEVVDLLDLVDPEVRTLGTLTNVQNSLFVPDLGRLINRRPTYNLTQRPTSSTLGERARPRAGTGAAAPPAADLPSIPQEPRADAEGTPFDIEMQQTPAPRRFSISSNLSDSRYAVLPHGISLDDWTEEDKAELDDHVRHLMHSRREGFRRSMRGFKQYISKPLGLFVFVYAVLITLFGAAWVLFLIGWIYSGPKKSYITDVVDNILVALFALMGDGLAPFRVVDTYHMCFIAHYYHLTWRLRREKKLPELVDHNDLPDRRVSNADVEDMIDKEETAEFSVLKPIQQRRLQYHQAKFSKAHTFYRPHETPTHHAFPLRLLVAVVVLLDFHSIFQITLGTCTWSWNYKSRPEALTATVLACSISCNITAGVLISVGDHRTRKKDVIERINRQNLTEEALERMAAKRHEEGVPRKSGEALRSSGEIARKNKQVSVANAQEAQQREAIEQTVGPEMIVHVPTGDEKEPRL